MKITNMIIIGDETFNIADLPEERRREIADKLNEQALTAIGYRKVGLSKEAKEERQVVL